MHEKNETEIQCALQKCSSRPCMWVHVQLLLTFSNYLKLQLKEKIIYIIFFTQIWYEVKQFEKMFYFIQSLLYKNWIY